MEITQGNESNPSVSAETAVESSTTVETQTPEGTAATSESSTPVYTPNYKFKVMDKEHEIPEAFRTIIKDAESEKQAREIFEKAHGLDYVKNDRDSVRNQLKEYRGQTEPVMKVWNQANTSYSRAMQSMEEGNFKSAMIHLQDAFGALKVPDKVLKQYVYNLVQMEELPAEQKTEYNNYRELERQSYTQQQQLEQYQSQLQQLSVQTRTSELQNALSKPEVASFVQAFDQRNGPGSFKNEVIMRGQYYAQAMGEDRSAEEVVSELLNRFGHQTAQPVASQAPTQAQSPAVNQPPPVIPTIKSGSGGPTVVARKAKSVADLKKLASQYTD